MYEQGNICNRGLSGDCLLRQQLETPQYQPKNANFTKISEKKLKLHVKNSIFIKKIQYNDSHKSTFATWHNNLLSPLSPVSDRKVQ